MAEVKIMKLKIINELIRVVENFWTPGRCAEFIRESERIGYGEALVKTDLGYRRVDSVRNNQRIIHDNFQLADTLWNEIKPHAPLVLGKSKAIGLNERFRFYKYQKGQQFKKHRDESFIRNSQECSYYTFMIYLNDDFEGGSTKFDGIEIEPKVGSCLMFYHPLDHEGMIIESGTKYILRTDVMYRIDMNM